jgi:phosphoribosylformimino-5-aminoimidazole carboxamide ribotide isomerase
MSAEPVPSPVPAMEFDLYPAIDVREGHMVRLHQGDYDRETRYEERPLGMAMRHARQGACWLHLVDLDAARHGGYTLLPLLRVLARTSWLRVQTGGGVRGEEDVARILEAGADRVVIGSLAVREPERVLGWVARFGAERITVALDARQDGNGEWQLPVSGWTETSAASLPALLRRFAEGGVRHLLCTDISRDGTLGGPNLDLYRLIARLAPELYVQASGGIRDIDDILAARAAGCSGAVLGKALIEGRFALDEALERVRRC